MKYHFFREFIDYDVSYRLSVPPRRKRALRYANGIAERFCTMGESLAKSGDIIGWEISFEGTGGSLGSVFSTNQYGLGPEDFQWIFEGGAEVSADPAFLCALYGGSAALYVLKPCKEAAATGKDREERALFSASVFECCRLFDCMKESNAVIRLTAGVSPEDGSLRGAVLLMLPEKITLRLRCSLKLALPFAEVMQIDSAREEPYETELFSGRQTEELFGLFFNCYYAYAEEEKEKEAEEKEKKRRAASADMDVRYGFPVEDLDLSVRSFNCLKKSDIHTITQIRKMSEDDLRRVCGLGVKGAAEVLKRLVEWENEMGYVDTDEDAPDKDGACVDEDAPEEDGADPGGGDPGKEQEECEEDGGKKVTEQAAGNCDPQPSSARCLDSMIGQEDVKKQIRKIVSFAKMKKDFSESQNDSLSIALNMEFVGNPGTAKTTVARIVAGIFHEIGLLPEDGLVEVGRANLVAKYVGQTALRVREAFKKAKGKVLFIDEVYSLVDDRNGSYDDETINTIVQEMENNRADTVVIFAGYPKEMAAFFDRNPGLRSRVPFRVAFRDYSADDLALIAVMEAEKRGFRVSDEARGKLLSVCRAAAGRPDTGNGHFSRNLTEHAILCYAQRVYGSGGSAAQKDRTLIGADFDLSEGFTVTKKEQPVGFCA